MPAIFTKNSVLDTQGIVTVEGMANLRDSPTMTTAMELHQRQLDVSTMSNNVSCKNSRLMELITYGGESTKHGKNHVGFHHRDNSDYNTSSQILSMQ